MIDIGVGSLETQSHASVMRVLRLRLEHEALEGAHTYILCTTTKIMNGKHKEDLRIESISTLSSASILDEKFLDSQIVCASSPFMSQAHAEYELQTSLGASCNAVCRSAPNVRIYGM